MGRYVSTAYFGMSAMRFSAAPVFLRADHGRERKQATRCNYGYPSHVAKGVEFS
jgi:hypothetical protein